MRVFQIGRHVHVVNCDNRRIERDFANDDSAELALNEFVYAKQSMFHGIFFVGRFCETLASDTDALQFLCDLLQLVALDDVSDMVLAEIAEFETAFQTGTHFFHIVLESSQSRHATVVNWLAAAQHSRARRSGDATVGDETSGHDAAT